VGSDRVLPDVCRAQKLSAAEAEVIEGWLAFGAALNEGRALFPSDEQFGRWVGVSQPATHEGREISRDDRAAAL
jgi:hypothetical protein